ncbi:MAG TPA: sigma 54-interacting transcriptional regulator [Terriglobales bacterium]|nr:sigma 54-interacting transcriptional regulator [Terriglobales bacterium]
MQQVPERYSGSGSPAIGEFSRRYRALLYAADVAARRGFPDLLQELSKLLHELFDFNFLNYALHDDHTDVMRIYMLDRVGEPPADPREFLIEESPAGWAWLEQRPLIIPDFNHENRFRTALEFYASKGFRSIMVFPMTTARRRLGTLSFGSSQPVYCDADVVFFLERLANLVALALENSLFLEVLLLREAASEEERQLQELGEMRLQLSQQSAEAYETLRKEREQLETIIEIQGALVASRLDLPTMFSALSKSLRKAISHDASFVTLWREREGRYEVYAAEPEEFKKRLQPTWFNVAETLTAHVLASAPQGAIIQRKQLEEQSERFPHLRMPLEAGLVSWCVVPMQSPNRMVGVFYLGIREEHAFTERDLELLRQLAGAIGFFVETSQARATVEMEKERLRMLLEFSRTLTSSLEWKKLFQDISTCIRKLTEQDYAHIGLHDPVTNRMRFYTLDFPERRGLVSEENSAEILESPTGICYHTKQTKIFHRDDLEKMGSNIVKSMLAEGIQTICCVPLISGNRVLGSLAIASVKPDSIRDEEVEILQQLAPQIAIAVENARAYGEISSLKDKLAKEKIYLEQEIRDSLNFEEVVGQSSALKQVLQQVKTVAPSTATVLILGETGTGKELIARAIHRLSSRSSGNFVKVNCAAIPTGLLESELFGHEKGAFTGAVSQKIGRLELADKGTLFLDEVGEIPLELQPKLLRALQDQEFERLGGTRTIRVNVRVLAATNRDLSKAVSEQEFRADLYYRLHVFPVRLPALRERPGDISLLVQYFVQKFARRMNKQIEDISAEAMSALEKWHWPGNIRELENFIERSVILTEGSSLRVPVGELQALPVVEDQPVTPVVTPTDQTLEEIEREYILKVLRRSRGVIAGSRGAAARLGMKRTTLQSKILRLGIRRDEYNFL